MIRALGSVLIAAGAVWAGVSATARYQGQVRGVEELARGLELLEQELEFSAPELEVLAEQVGERASGAGKALFTSFARRLGDRKENSAAELWQTCILELEHLPPEVRECLFPLGQVLGRYDSREQRSCVRGIRQRLEELGRGLRDQSRHNCRLSQTAALSGGAFLIILLL